MRKISKAKTDQLFKLVGKLEGWQASVSHLLDSADSYTINQAKSELLRLVSKLEG